MRHSVYSDTTLTLPRTLLTPRTRCAHPAPSRQTRHIHTSNTSHDTHATSLQGPNWTCQDLGPGGYGTCQWYTYIRFENLVLDAQMRGGCIKISHSTRITVASVTTLSSPPYQPRMCPRALMGCTSPHTHTHTHIHTALSRQFNAEHLISLY